MSHDLLQRVKPYVPTPARRLLKKALGVARRDGRRAPEDRTALEWLRPIMEIGPDDVMVAGAMKSGNTWFRLLIASAIFGADVDLVPPRLLYLLVPDVQFDRYYIRYAPTVFFKSHELPRPEIRRVVYLLRDGRDVMVSLYHHLRSLRGSEDIDFLELARGSRDPCRWDEHVQAWMANPYDADMIVIRYEDLLADGVKELQRFCEFVGVEREPAVLERALSNSRIDRIRGFEQRYGALYHPRWNPERPFFRRGEVGSHRDEMPPEALEAFLRRAGPTLREMGYLD